MTVGGPEEADPLDEMARENDVIRRLDERLAEFATSLSDGADVAPGEIAEGLRLYAQYVGAHARRFDESLQPEARPVAMPTCFEHLDAISRDRRGLSERIARAQKAVDAYAAAGDAMGRAGLVKELEAFTQHEYEQVRYENDYPLSCLRATLPEDAAQRVRTGFDRTVGQVGDLDRHIDRYLGETPGKVAALLAIRCAQPGCPQRATAEGYPAANGHLGIRGPAGWKLVPAAPRASKDGKRLVVVDVDFWCPDHRNAGGSVPSTMAGRTDLELGTRTTTEPPVAACCGPVPSQLS